MAGGNFGGACPFLWKNRSIPLKNDQRRTNNPTSASVLSVDF